MTDVRSWMGRGLTVLLLVCLPSAPCWAVAKPYGAATPQELVARMKTAAQGSDLGEMMACMAPEDQKAIGGGMMMMAVMMVGFSSMAMDMGSGMAEAMGEAMGGEETSAEQQAEMAAQKAAAAAAAATMTAKLRTALESQGLAGLLDETPDPGTAEDAAMEAALDKADMVELTSAMMSVLADMKDMPGAEPGSAPDPAEEAKPDWTDREVTGYAIDGDHATAQAGDETLELVRVEGRWYFAPQTSQPGEGDAPGDDDEDAGDDAPGADQV